MVYVLNNNGQPLMPTKRHGKVRRLLKSGKAKVVNNCPFTIRLLYQTGGEIQPITLGVDAGSKHIGLSATTDTEELYAGDKVNNGSLNCKKINLICHNNGWLTERREPHSSPT